MYLLRKSFGFSRTEFKPLVALALDGCIYFDPDDLVPYKEAMLTRDLGEEPGSNVYCSTDEGSRN